MNTKNKLSVPQWKPLAINEYTDRFRLVIRNDKIFFETSYFEYINDRRKHRYGLINITKNDLYSLRDFLNKHL